MPPRPKLTSLSTEIATRIVSFLGQEDYSACSLISRKFCEPAQELLWRKQRSLLPILMIIPAFDFDEETGLWGLPPFEGEPPISADELKHFDKVRARVRFLDITFSSDFWDICPKTIKLLQQHYGDKPKGLFPNLVSLEATYSCKASLVPVSILHFLHSPVLRKAVFLKEDQDRPLDAPGVLCPHVATYLNVISWKLRDGCRFRLQWLRIYQGPDLTLAGSLKLFRGLRRLDIERNYTVPIRHDLLEALSTLTKLESLSIMAPKFLDPVPPSSDSTLSPSAAAAAAAARPRPYFEHLENLELSSYFSQLTNFFNLVEFANVLEVVTRFWVHEDTYRSHTYEWGEFFDALYCAVEHDNPIDLELTPVELHSNGQARFANMFDEEKFPAVPFEEFSESILQLNLSDFSLPDPLVRHFESDAIENMLAKWLMFETSSLEDENRRRYI